MQKKRYLFEFWALPKEIAADKKLTLSDKAVLSSIITRMNGENQLKVKQETIANDWGVGIRSIQRSITKLERLGYLSFMRPGKTLCNRYEIKL